MMVVDSILKSPKGGKWWRFKYRFGGKEKRISLEVYTAQEGTRSL